MIELLNIDCMEYMATQDDMQVGKAGEYLVCADRDENINTPVRGRYLSDMTLDDALC